MTFFEFVAGIVEAALAPLRHPEAVTEMEIEHAPHYSKESRAWGVTMNGDVYITVLYVDGEFFPDDL